VSERFPRVCLAAALAAIDAAFAFAFGSPVGWGLAVLPVAAIFLTLPALPRSLTSTLLWTSRVLLGVAAPASTGLAIAYPVGIALALLSGVFFLTPASFGVATAVLPAAFGVLLLAAGNPFPPHLEVLVWASAAALTLWLITASAAAMHPRRVVATLILVLPAIFIGRGIIQFLPWAQPHVEAAAFKYMTPGQAEAGLSMGSSLGSVEQLALTRTVVLRLWSDRPVYLRTAAYAHFNGFAWQAGKARPARPFVARAVDAPESWTRGVPGAWTAAPGTDLGGPASFARIVLAERLRDMLPSPASVQAVRLTEPGLRLDAFGVVLPPPTETPDVYGVRYLPGPIADDEDEEMIAQCREPPAALDPRVHALAQTLGGDAGPVETKIARTVAHLYGHYHYTLKVGKWKTHDPLAEFLFDKKQGYCEYFATAAVVLLRLQGVPARYVSGLSVREMNRVGDHYLVRSSDAHAWAEALVPGKGWVQVDATPPAEFDALHAPEAPSGLEEWLERLKAAWASLLARVRAGGLAAVWASLSGAVKALVVIAPLAWAAWKLRGRLGRRRRASVAAATPPDGTDPRLRACFARLEAAWSRAGHPRPPHRGPLEHARALPDQESELRVIGSEIVDAFYRGAFGGQDVSAEETARLDAALARAAALSEASASRRSRPGGASRS
jgi:transglutaminase-like putative cysteine protease